jgi:hypothetical protein
MPQERVSCALHFTALATTLATAKVLLATIGTTLFLSHEGPARLPLFYICLALLTVVLSFGLSLVVDRLSKIGLAQAVFGGGLLAAAALYWPIALEIPGAPFALLASAHIFEISLDIVFWVVVAGFVDTVELKRVTPVIYMALAIGGAIGGGTARALASVFSAAEMLWTLPLLAMALVAQLRSAGRCLSEVPDGDAADRPADVLDSLAGLFDLANRYPLSLLIALNALVLTILYGLSEYLVFSVYSERFPDEQELTRFLALVFALLQAIEFMLLYAVSWPLLERTGPLVRNLVFPLTSFASLIYLIASQKLPAALVLHVNAEAVSNAIFQPINNANYIPLPLRFQGRARTLSDGIFYPTGLALAGGILMLMPEQGVTPAVGFAALMFAGLFVLLAAGAGLLFRPTLHANLGSDLIRPGQATGALAPAPSLPRVRALLHSREAELRLLGLALAQRLDPEVLEGDLLALATRPDRPTRAALAGLIAAAPPPWAQNFLDRCMAGRTEEELKLALLVMLIRRALPKPEQMERVLGAPAPAVAALGQLVAKGCDARPQVQPLLRDPDVASDLLDAIVSARRSDCSPLLLAGLETAAPEQQRRALGMLGDAAGAPGAAMTEAVRRLARHRNPAVRADAVVFLSRARPQWPAIQGLIGALDDLDGRVRRRAAEALCQYGDRTTALLRHRLRDVTIASPDAVWSLAQIASPQARGLLGAYVRRLRDDAARTTGLLGWIAASPDRARWAALELCLRDHLTRIIEVVLAALSPAIEDRLALRVRHALQGADQRRRASAFELIAAGPASRVAPGAVALLRYLLFEDGAGPRSLAGADGREEVLDRARLSMSPWVRYAASRLDARAALPFPVATAAGPIDRPAAGGDDMALDQEELERIVALKRAPLFRRIPFETMLEVARSVQARAYLEGEEVVAGGAGWRDLLILETGTLSIAQADGAGSLAAPACFGEIAFADERVPWPRITALEDSRVSFLRATVFEELCREHPELPIALSRLLARRLREAGEAESR